MQLKEIPDSFTHLLMNYKKSNPINKHTINKELSEHHFEELKNEDVPPELPPRDEND